MTDYTQLASPEIVEKTIESLAKNGISAEVVASANEAKEKIMALIPEKAEVMTMTSVTLSETGIEEELNTSGKYTSLKQKLGTMNRETDGRQMQMIGAAPEWAIGSVHAITENGQVIVASNTGSQLPAYVYGADHVIWIVSTKKIVKDLEDGMSGMRKHSINFQLYIR